MKIQICSTFIGILVRKYWAKFFLVYYTAVKGIEGDGRDRGQRE